MLELDLSITKDLEVIVIHDPSLERLCGVKKRVEQFNYDDLPSFSEEVPIHFSNKLIFHRTNKNYFPKLEVL